jgi:hypothetical protein
MPTPHHATPHERQEPSDRPRHAATTPHHMTSQARPQPSALKRDTNQPEWLAPAVLSPSPPTPLSTSLSTDSHRPLTPPSPPFAPPPSPGHYQRWQDPLLIRGPLRQRLRKKVRLPGARGIVPPPPIDHHIRQRRDGGGVELVHVGVECRQGVGPRVTPLQESESRLVARGTGGGSRPAVGPVRGVVGRGGSSERGG